MLSLRKVAVTGGLSSGKSTVCNILRQCGAYVVSADEIVHQLLSPETPLGKRLIHLLGQEVVTDGEFSRKAIAKKVFTQPLLLKELEALLHPAVYEVMKKEFETVKKSGATKLFVAEIPLLFESGKGSSWFDAVITVTSLSENCLQRFIAKGGTREEYQNRMQNQMPQQMKADQSDYIISNDLDISSLKEQVKDLYQILIQQES